MQARPRGGASRYPTVLRTTPQQRRASIGFSVVAVLFGVVMLFNAATLGGDGVGGSLAMALFFFLLATVGVSVATAQVACNSQEIAIRGWFRTKIVPRNSIESITGGPIVAIGMQIGVRIAVYGRRRPLVPGSMRTYDTKKNRLLLAKRLAALNR